MDLSTKNVLFAVFCAASVSASDKMTCVIGYLNSCHENQKCVGISVGSRAGYCDCLEGYISVEDGPGGEEGCVSKNSTGHSNPSSSAIVGRTSSSLATALFAVILVLLGVMVVLVVVYVVRRVRLSRLRNRRMSGALAAAISGGSGNEAEADQSI